MMRFVITLFLVSFLQDELFEGKITYSLKSFDQNGDLSYSPIKLVDVYYSKTKKISKVVSGDFKLMVGDYFLFVDIDQKFRSEVWESEEKIVDLGIEPAKKISYIFKKSDSVATILGYSCDHYFIKRKHQHELDTAFIELFVAKDIQIPSLQIVEVIGNSSLDNLDGSIEGLPLKIIIRNGERTIEQKAIEVKRGNLNASLSNYLRDLKVN